LGTFHLRLNLGFQLVEMPLDKGSLGSDLGLKDLESIYFELRLLAEASIRWRSSPSDFFMISAIWSMIELPGVASSCGSRSTMLALLSGS